MTSDELERIENVLRRQVSELDIPEKRRQKVLGRLRWHFSGSAETDRGLALIRGAQLETVLGELLGASLAVRAERKSMLDTPRAPLGTFATRIDVAYALGLIGGHFRTELHLARRIRNEFAHSPQPLSFDVEPIRGWATSFATVFPDDWQPSPRTRFEMASGSLVTMLDTLAESVEPLEYIPSFGAEINVLSDDEKQLVWARACRIQAGDEPEPRRWYGTRRVDH